MVVQLMALEESRFDDWRRETRSRLISLRQESGMLVGEDAVTHADAFLDQLLADGHGTRSSRILSVLEDERELGTIWLGVSTDRLFIVDFRATAPFSDSQLDQLFALVREIASGLGVSRISAGVYAHDAAGRALIDGRGFALASIQMILEPLPERQALPQIDVAPMTAERFPSFAAASEEGFAKDLVASGRYSPSDARAESHRQMSLELPDGADTPGQELFTGSVDGTEVGILWLGMRTRAGRPHAFILDIEVAESERRKGYGRELMYAAEREARRLGADSIGLHVFGFNAGAIRLYEDLGYRRVEESYHLDL